MTNKFDIDNPKAGGLLRHEETGVEVLIPARSDREFIAIYGSTVYDFIFYEEEQEGEDPSDRIHLLITTADDQRVGGLMNAQDALTIIEGLTVCVQRAIEAGIPLLPAEEEAGLYDEPVDSPDV